MMSRVYNRVKVGDKYNHLTLIKRLRTKLKGEKYTYYGIWKCDCGMERMINLHNVSEGNTRSCGCLYKISNKTNPKRSKTKHI
jgi:hypothetical protein